MTNPVDSVARHYEDGGIGDRILDALRGQGIDVDNLSHDQLATIDQFHTRGLAVTRAQAEMVAPAETMHVLDLGCGIGGPARFLAATYGCRVTGIDLTEAFVGVARMLTDRCELADQVDFHQGNAMDLPFEESSFDLVWSQNVSMNIPDKAAFYAEAFRVLKPGGKFTSTEMTAGSGGDLPYPLTWARDPSISFVISQEEMKAALASAGFRILEWRDTTDEVVSDAKAGGQKARMSPLGVALIAGEDFPQRSANNARCLAEGLLTNIVMAAEKPA